MSRAGRAATTRRRFLLASAMASGLALDACRRGDDDSAGFDGGWVGASHERGHLVRGGLPPSKSGALPPTTTNERVGAIVVGGGVAGLAAARALARSGIDDVRILELEDEAGGNARGHAIGGLRCPLGAHYLPVPGAAASEVAELLDELKLRRVEHGRAVYDERTLCYSPQERLFIAGGWRDGLLPPIDALPAEQRAATLAHYRKFAATVADVGRDDAFVIPTARARWTPALEALDRVTFAAWLDANAITAPALRWYLDYCCRDDYGAGAAQVSAWAGLHYFASRHGFRAGGGDEAPAAESNEGLLTWPEGNAWLTRHMAAPFADRLRAGRVVLRIDEGRDSVTVDAWDVGARRLERWHAPRVVIATPLFVAARLVAQPLPALLDAARRARHAPWLVANMHIGEPLDDRPGAPPSWDNVLYASPSLGYVDAAHQSLSPLAGATVLTAYWALGGDDAASLDAGRAALLGDDWRTWATRVVADIAAAHADLRGKIRRIDLMRYGHAMSVPVPGLRSSAALQALAAPQRRVHYAHADLSAYSVFEEALYHGTRAGRAAAVQSIA